MLLSWHIGGHIGGHIEFTGDLYAGHPIWWLHQVGHGQKHIPRHQKYDSICNIHEVMSVLMYLHAVSSAILAAILAAILDLSVIYKLGNDFYAFTWLRIVENISVDITNVTLCWFCMSLWLFLRIHLLCSCAILAAILAAILDLKLTCM
jgi:hypothetical protein